MNRQPRFILSRLAQNYYEEFFFFFLLIMAFSIPTSRLVMSMSQIALASLWVLDGRYRDKLKLFFQNKIALILGSLFALHLVGLLYTQDFDSALSDLRIKLPLLLLPLFFSSSVKFNKKKAQWVVYAFIAGVLYASLFTGVEDWISGEDIKAILSDHFIKHMRFSLSINLAIFALFFLALAEWKKMWPRVLAFLIVLWLLVFMLKMGALSAYVIFALLLVFLWLYSLIKTTGIGFIINLIAFSISLGATTYFILSFLTPQVLIKESIPPEEKTALGNDYYHMPLDVYENGKPIYHYVCEEELSEQWNNRSALTFYGNDNKDQELKATLIRYLTSLDLRKDSLGLSQLSNWDIQNVEHGIANVNYATKSKIEVRLMQLVFELEQFENNPSPDGYSLGQRREYWAVSWHMIKKAWLFGSGTGDNSAKMQDGYQETNSKLSPDLWFHPHNQFLSFWLSFGVLGLLFFLFVLFYPPLSFGAFRNPIYWFFFLSVFFSFFVEDLLETQSGVTYFTFFNAFFLILWSFDSAQLKSKKVKK